MALGALTMQNSASWQKQAWATLLLVLAGGLNLASWLPRSLLPFPIWYGMLAFAGLVLLEVLWGGMVNRRFWHFPRTPLDFALLITGLQIGVSLYATYDLAQSLPKVYGLSSSLLVFLTLQRWVQLGRWQWWLGLVGYITAGVVVAVLGGSAAKVLPTALAMHLPALFELNANELGGVLLWFAPLAAVCSLIALLNIQKRWWLILPAAGAGIATVLIIAVLGFTRSRSALVGLGLAGMIGFVLLLIRQKGWLRLLMLFVLLAGLAGAYLVVLNPQWLPNRINIFAKQGSDAAISGREELWSRGLYALEDFPLTGMGMNTFRKLVHVIYPLFSYAPNSDISHAHNQIIQIGVDLGIPALIAFLAMLILLHGLLFKIWMVPDLTVQLLALGFLGAIWASLGYGVADAVAYGAKPGVFWWGLLALACQVERASALVKPPLYR
jgi:putative inorganic carbon (HCO3(-)) transporter